MSGPVDTPYDASFFEGQGARSLKSACVVLGQVFPMLRPRRVLDVGCGIGGWMRAALDLGASEVVGTDGDYVDPASLLVDRDLFIPADLVTQALPAVLGARATTPFDLVICMEVAEHLPHARAPSLVAELTAVGNAVLFSAAVPFQYGVNHVNEQWPEYWAILFRAHGFDCYDPLRAELWNHPSVDWWYAQNALLFARRGTPAATSLPAASRTGSRGLSLVHPDNLLSNLLGLPRRHRQHASEEEALDLHSLIAAQRSGAAELPALAGPARAARAAPGARDVFPWTRNEIYVPEREIAELSQEAADLRQAVADRAQEAADLSRKLGETGDFLRAANQAFTAERAARFAAERNAQRRQELLQAHAATRLAAEVALGDYKAADAERRVALSAERGAIAGELAARRQVLQAEYDRAHVELNAHAVELSRQAVELDRRRTELDREAAQVEAVRRSRVWRASRRAQAIGGRIATRLRPAPPAPDALESVTLPPNAAEAPAVEPTARLVEAEIEAPPDKPPINLRGQVVAKVNWWTLAAAITRLRRLDVFDGADYLRHNPDVAAAGLDPYAHFIQSGALEGRGRVDPEELARIMSGLALFDHAVRALPRPEPDDGDLPGLVSDVAHIGIFASSHGNVFMDDLADDLAADLRSVGVRVDVLDENTDVDTRPPTCLFVAPHEFFLLGRGPEWIRDDVLSDSFMFGTEQVQTTWFNMSLPFILMSRGLLDICTQTADLFERLDMASMHVLPGARLRPRALTERDRRHALFGVLPPAACAEADPATPFASRPIDVSFFGASSPRRDQFFARNAPFFADYETFNYCRRPGRGPIRGDGEDGALSRLAGHVAGHSKVMLNIHQDAFGYFEWHRMVRLGMCSGSLVVSDPCLPHPDFVANEHYLQENPRHIPDLIEWLLRTDDGAREAERVRGNVDRLMAAQFGTTHAAARLLRFFALHRSRDRG